MWVGMIGICGLEYSMVGIEYLKVGMTRLGGSESELSIQ